MSQKFEVKDTTKATQLDSYVVSCDPVSVCERNRDYTLVVPSLKMGFGIGSDPVSVADIIKVYEYNSLYPFFVGFVNKKDYDVYSDSYTAEVLGLIGKLQGVKLLKSTIEPLLTSANLYEDNPSDVDGLPNVQMFYLIKVLFESITGYTLVVSHLLDTDIETKTPRAGGGSGAFKFKHICMDLNMVYALGVGVAAPNDIIERNSTYLSQLWTAFDLISNFCSALGLTLVLTQSGTSNQFILYLASQTIYPFEDDSQYEVKYDTIVGKPGGYSISVLFDGDRSHFTGTNDTALTEQQQIISGDGANTISFHSNFIMPYRDITLYDYADGEIYPISGTKAELSTGTCEKGIYYTVTAGTVEGHGTGETFKSDGTGTLSGSNKAIPLDMHRDTCYSLVDLAEDYRQMNKMIKAQVGNYSAVTAEYRYIIDNTTRANYNRIDLKTAKTKFYQEAEL